MSTHTKIVLINTAIIYLVVAIWIVYEWINAPLIIEDEEMKDFDK
jgi:hypothetical protein